MTDDEFRQKTLLSLSTMTRLIWGINQVLIYGIEDDPESGPLVKALRDSQKDMLDAAQDLGVDIKPFEAYEIKVSTRENKNN